MRVQQRNIHYLAIEMFKVKLGIVPTFRNDISQTRVIPDGVVVRSLRSQIECYNYKDPKTVYYRTETLPSLGPKIWNILPSFLYICILA